MLRPDEKSIIETVELAAEQTGFSGVVRVSVGQDVVVEHAYGLADRSSKSANSVGTRFGIASGGKLFTALGIGVLLDEDRLRIDARLSELVDHELLNVPNDVTVAQLLSHTSGVYDYYDEEAHTEVDAFELPIPPFKLVETIDYLPMLVSGEAKFPAGTRFSYSNGGYVLLGLVIEAVSKTPYHRFIEQRVLAPCGMSCSGFFRFDRLPERVATGYIEEDGQWRSNIYTLPIIGGPDGGLFCTVGDVEGMWRVLLSGELLSSDLVATYLTASATWKQDIHYGYGVWIRDDGTKPKNMYVEGCDAGVSFKSTCYGDDQFATVMSNTTEGAWPLADAIDALFATRPAG